MCKGLGLPETLQTGCCYLRQDVLYLHGITQLASQAYLMKLGRACSGALGTIIFSESKYKILNHVTPTLMQSTQFIQLLFGPQIALPSPYSRLSHQAKLFKTIQTIQLFKTIQD